MVQFPVLETWKDQVFFSFGLDYKFRGYLFPAFYIPNTGDKEYALSLRLSVFDRRKKRNIGQWEPWTTCDGIENCGTGYGQIEISIKN